VAGEPVLEDLSRSLDEWNSGKQLEALKRAQALLPKAGDRAGRLIKARLHEKGLIDTKASADARKKNAIKALDEMLSLYEDDEEAWFYRGKLVGDEAGVPFYKALLKINPLHPGANHELVHYYEHAKRPALGWVYAENYIRSSPGVPHSFHMQAHLATRIGRWELTTDRSVTAVELERAYHKTMKVAPKDDHQFGHHLETLTYTLVHDGRFREARQIMAEARGYDYQHWQAWFRLFAAENDWDALAKLADEVKKKDKPLGAYFAALALLGRRTSDPAVAEVEALREAHTKKPKDRPLEYRLWETEGLLKCQRGSLDEGLKLLENAALKSKDDFGHHAWGNGAYYMEVWGQAALATGRLAVAEEAFLEALAHDAGSVRAAMGLQALCAKQNRPDEAARYAAMARKCWRNSEIRSFDALAAKMSEIGTREKVVVASEDD
jgi:hypothetical protein